MCGVRLLRQSDTMCVLAHLLHVLQGRSDQNWAIRILVFIPGCEIALEQDPALSVEHSTTQTLQTLPRRSG